MRPNSSNVVEFISSWIAFGPRLMTVFVVCALRVLKPNELVPLLLMRTRPSQRCVVAPAALQLLLAAKLVPYAEL